MTKLQIAHDHLMSEFKNVNRNLESINIPMLMQETDPENENLVTPCSSETFCSAGNFENAMIDSIQYTKDWTHLPQYNVDGAVCSLNQKSEYNITIVNIAFNKNGCFPRHSHDRVERVFVLAGSYYDYVNDIVFSEGDVQFIKPFEDHSSKSDSCLLTVTWAPAYYKI